MNEGTARIRALSVEQWRELTREGVCIPVRFQLSGNSMWPLIRIRRDYVTVLPLNRPLKRGDVVLFADQIGRYVVHRVWKLDETCVTTLGDHCYQPDPPLEYSRVWGIVTKLERGSRVISLDCSGARAWGRFWMSLLPLRRMYDRCRSFAKQIYHKLKGR